MNTDVRSQDAGVREFEGLGALGVCQTHGCGRLATVDSELGIMCRHCWIELMALGQEAERRREKQEARELYAELRRQDIREAFQRVGAFVRKWIWVPNLLFVIAVGVYVEVVYGWQFIAWLRGE